MTEQRTNSGNEIIAEFEGLTWNERQWYEYKGSTTGNGCWVDENALTAYSDDTKIGYYTIPYHSDWRCLMPVFEKIVNIKFDDLDTPYARTFGMRNGETGKFMTRLNRHVVFEADTMTESLWLAVVDFLKIHKENNEKKENGR